MSLQNTLVCNLIIGKRTSVVKIKKWNLFPLGSLPLNVERSEDVQNAFNSAFHLLGLQERLSWHKVTLKS